MPRGNGEVGAPARNTMFIDTNDAAYWLAASSFVEHDDRRSQTSSQTSPQTSSHSSATMQSAAAPRKNLNLSLARGRAPPSFPPPRLELPPVPMLPSSRPEMQHLSPARLEEPFASPRPAPPTPKHLGATKPARMPLSPISPLSLSTAGTQNPLQAAAMDSLASPAGLTCNDAAASPTLSHLSSHPGSSLLQSPSQFSSPTQGMHASMQSLYSSRDSRLSNAGATIISAFPTPPTRFEQATARMLDVNEWKQMTCNASGTAMDSTLRRGVRVSKPLPELPMTSAGALSSPYDSLRERRPSSGSYADSTSDSEGGLAYRAIEHRPMCPYAHHTTAPEDEQCACELDDHHPYGDGLGGKMSTSAPNLLDSVQAPDAASSHQADTKQRDLIAAKNVISRLSDEIRGLQLVQKREQPLPPPPPAQRPQDEPSVKRTIKWQDQLLDAERPLIAPLNKALPVPAHEKERLRSVTPDPSRPIQEQLWPPAKPVNDRSLTPSPSFGLTASMMHAHSVQEGYYDFTSGHLNVAASQGYRATPATPPGSARRLISTVRSHDRNQPARPSPTHQPVHSRQPKRSHSPGANDAMGHSDHWDVPRKGEAADQTGRHHRQTSSKSSLASSGGCTSTTHGSSSHGAGYASSTASSSSPNTPPQWATRLNSKGKPMPSKKEGKAMMAASLLFFQTSPRRPKHDTAYLTSAVEPFVPDCDHDVGPTSAASSFAPPSYGYSAHDGGGSVHSAYAASAQRPPLDREPLAAPPPMTTIYEQSQQRRQQTTTQMYYGASP